MRDPRTLDGLLESMIEIAPMNYTDKPLDYEAPPTFVLVSPSREEHGKCETTIFVAPWKDDEEKQQVMTMIAMYAYAKGVTHYAVVSEAWVSVVEQKDMHKARPMPRNDPQRREVLSIVAVDEGGRKIAASFNFRRDEGQEHPLLELVEHKDMKIEGGALTRLLVKTPLDLPDHVREAIISAFEEHSEVETETFH